MLESVNARNRLSMIVSSYNNKSQVDVINSNLYCAAPSDEPIARLKPEV